MKKLIAILSLLTITSTAFSATNTIRCVLGSGNEVGLSLKAHFLTINIQSSQVMEFGIFEQNFDGSKGDLLLKKEVLLKGFDAHTLRSVYQSEDGLVQLTTNSNQKGEVLSTFISGKREVNGKLKSFHFEGRSCRLK